MGFSSWEVQIPKPQTAIEVAGGGVLADAADGEGDPVTVERNWLAERGSRPEDFGNRSPIRLTPAIWAASPGTSPPGRACRPVRLRTFF
jgi:hypothetical protein